MTVVRSQARSLLLLDLDGVLRRFDPPAAVERAHGLAPGSLAAVAFRRDLIGPAVTGLVTHDRWLATVADALVGDGVPADTAGAAVRAWSTPGFVIADALALVRAARARCRVALLTNATTRLGADLAFLGLDREVDGVVSSAETGAEKPDPEAYLAALALLDARPEETLFCDDKAGNVTAAAALGLAAAHVPDTDALRTALSVHGLLG
ncbi:HAD-IA family hydrolase [Actinokineospora sp.]|uniref:HAD-IA family hydrolase n=1 Tax=Actinokineospora sp. TaxID=1872133 RepID=UPI004037AB3D